MAASKVQKQSEINALSVAMAEQRTQDEESKADAAYRTAGISTHSTERYLQEKAEAAHERVNLEEAAQRLCAVESEQQREQNTKEINEHRLRNESNSRNMQQRLIELEHQSRAATEVLRSESFRA